MNYPALGIQWGAKEAMALDRSIDRATNGSARGRAFYTAPKSTFDVTHMLNAADWATYKAFYAANLTATFVLAWQGQNYTCIFASEPVYTPVAFDIYSVSVTLTQV